MTNFYSSAREAFDNRDSDGSSKDVYVRVKRENGELVYSVFEGKGNDWGTHYHHDADEFSRDFDHFVEFDADWIE